MIWAHFHSSLKGPIIRVRWLFLISMSLSFYVNYPFTSFKPQRSFGWTKNSQFKDLKTLPTFSESIPNTQVELIPFLQEWKRRFPQQAKKLFCVLGLWEKNKYCYKSGKDKVSLISAAWQRKYKELQKEIWSFRIKGEGERGSWNVSVKIKGTSEAAILLGGPVVMLI